MSPDAVVDDFPKSTPVPFYESRWTTRALIVGLVFISTWRLSAFLDRDWLQFIPWVVSLVVFGVLPEAFLLLYPILTRFPRNRFYIPSVRKCLVEFGIAIPIVIVTLLLVAATEYLLDHFWPGTSLQPEEFTRLSQSSNKAFMYLLLTCAFAFAPVAEELFFRGFLQNALRARTPRVIAIIAQALIFGFTHSFSVLHSIAACFMGLILATVYEWRRTLVTPILIHAGVNATAAIGVLILAAQYANSPVLGVSSDPRDTACVVRHIVPNSAAEKAGLQIDDVIQTFNTVPVRDLRQLAEFVRSYKPGDRIPIEITRSGQQRTLYAVLQRRDE